MGEVVVRRAVVDELVERVGVHEVQQASFTRQLFVLEGVEGGVLVLLTLFRCELAERCDGGVELLERQALDGVVGVVARQDALTAHEGDVVHRFGVDETSFGAHLFERVVDDLAAVAPLGTVLVLGAGGLRKHCVAHGSPWVRPAHAGQGVVVMYELVYIIAKNSKNVNTLMHRNTLGNERASQLRDPLMGRVARLV